MESIICNKCAKKIYLKNKNIPYEDYVEFEKSWGYFSNKDGEEHSFVLCEECYDAIISEFAIPVTKNKRVELI